LIVIAKGVHLMTDGKIAIILLEGLPGWQALNATAFLASGVAARFPELIGESYRDRDGGVHNALFRQPVIVLAANGALMRVVRDRARKRDVPTSIYVRAMFSTGDDDANRTALAAEDPNAADIAGLGLFAPRRIVDRVTKGARMHP
jgi:hypothetical protein